MISLTEPQLLGIVAVAYAAASAVLVGGGVSGRLLARAVRGAVRCWLAYGRTRAAAMRRPHHRRAHRARRPRPRLTAVLTAAHLTLTRHTPGGTR